MNPNLPLEMYENDVKIYTIDFGNVAILGRNGTILVPYLRGYGTRPTIY